MDAYLAHCKVHTDRNILKKRRRSYLLHFVQSSLRRQSIQLKNRVVDKKETIETSDQRILRKLGRSQFHYKAERSRGNEPWVPTQKLPRLLTTSASAIRKIQRLGEIHDIDVERQVKVNSICPISGPLLVISCPSLILVVLVHKCFKQFLNCPKIKIFSFESKACPISFT